MKLPTASMFSRSHRLSALLLGAGLLSACAPSGPETTEILWDTWGVPHIYGRSEADLFRAFGWAQMQSHGNLILRLYGQARGRAAEYWGEGFLPSDRWLRSMGVPERAEQWRKQQKSSFRRNLEAFAEGMNAYAEAHPEQIDDALEVVLPVDAVDVLAHFQQAVIFTFVTNPQSVVSQVVSWQEGGSNAWAIAPSRTASGNAMLLANPHLPWSDLFLFYEAHLIGPGYDAYGTTLVGIPVLAIAFNDHLGWTHTVNTHDGADFYELELSSGGYIWDGEIRSFDFDEQTLRVRQADGSLREEQLRVKRSEHGPVIDEGQGFALALRVVGLDRPRGAQTWWEMGKATNLGQFEKALKRMQLPMFTVIYADREGHIMHLFGGLTPVRPEGSWNWSGIVPGDVSATLWKKTHGYKDLPRVLDPESGWLQNANDPPWTTTLPPAIDPDSFPAYMAPRFMHFRAQRSARMLFEDDTISFDELIAYKHSTRMELADHIVDDLIVAARERGGRLLRQAANVLQAWDRSTDPDSRGAVLFIAAIGELMGPSGSDVTSSTAGPYAVAWDINSPFTTPDGFADRAAAADALAAAARQVLDTYGSLRVRFGDVYRLVRGDVDLPGNGWRDNFGVFRATWYGSSGNGRYEAFGGDSYVAAIEFSDPPRAMAALGYGNSSQPGSPHLTDQMTLYAEKRLRPVWRTREEIEANLTSRTNFE